MIGDGVPARLGPGRHDRCPLRGEADATLAGLAGSQRGSYTHVLIYPVDPPASAVAITWTTMTWRRAVPVEHVTHPRGEPNNALGRPLCRLPG